jgi:DNA-binding response OmpR family regulator
MENDSRAGVLVVEDEEELADVYSGWLREQYDVKTAYRGDEALDRFDDTVDVVLLDRRMPGRSGDEVLERIKESGHDCRVAMVTAINPELDIIDMEFDDYLVKPVTKDELLETVEGLLALQTYNDRVREYYSLSAKHTALMTNNSEAQLADKQEYQDLKARLAEVQTQFEDLREELDYDQLKQAFKQIDFEAASDGPTPADEG